MTDIVERLRDACNGHPAAKIPWPHRVLHEAAAEIERLRAVHSEPNAVHLNMLRGVIARPSLGQIEHIYQHKFESQTPAPECELPQYPAASE